MAGDIFKNLQRGLVAYPMTDFPDFLLNGHRKFKGKTFSNEQEVYHRLATEGQNPDVMVIACSDSRVSPTQIFNADPGELFMVRNVANLVPPYEEDGRYHGVSAALEFGVRHLEVGHVVVLGHTGCGGINAMLDPKAPLRDDMRFISNWVSMMADARDAVLREMADADFDDQMDSLEQRTINKSIENLRSFPFVKERVDAGKLALHGAYFDVGRGSLIVRAADGGSYAVVD